MLARSCLQRQQQPGRQQLQVQQRWVLPSQLQHRRHWLALLPLPLLLLLLLLGFQRCSWSWLGLLWLLACYLRLLLW
jgi:TRAP-type uncharacterized transport system fused permease subunit